MDGDDYVSRVYLSDELLSRGRMRVLFSIYFSGEACRRNAQGYRRQRLTYPGHASAFLPVQSCSVYCAVAKLVGVDNKLNSSRFNTVGTVIHLIDMMDLPHSASSLRLNPISDTATLRSPKQ